MDVVRSKRPLTASTCGPGVGYARFDVRVCRVLRSERPWGRPRATLRNWLAVLMPLKLTGAKYKYREPLTEIAGQSGTPAESGASLIWRNGERCGAARLHEIITESFAKNKSGRRT